MASPQQLRTTVTDLLKINHPVMLAGMNVAAGPKLAAAVTNAGGLGVIGGVGYTPDMLREQIAELKGFLKDKNAPFGVDLLIPQVGGNARKTNYDYTKGKLDELVTIIIDSGAKLFVSAIGVPPKHVVERLHKAGVLYMNMIGHPKHVQKCLDVGVDMICAQGGEGGGHTGDVPTTILIPTVAQMCKGKKSPMTGDEVQVVAAGGLFNGQSLAAALMLGASAVWIGTRFVLCEEAGAPKAHQEAVRTSDFDDNVRTIIFTGRPLRVRKNPYIENWETNRAQEIKDLTAKGTIPVEHDFETLGDDLDDETMDNARPFLMGKAAAVVNERKSAKEIVDEMVGDAVQWLGQGQKMVTGAVRSQHSTIRHWNEIEDLEKHTTLLPNFLFRRVYQIRHDMRLLETSTFELKEFFDADIPEYAVPSHRYFVDVLVLSSNIGMQSSEVWA